MTADPDYTNIIAILALCLSILSFIWSISLEFRKNKAKLGIQRYDDYHVTQGGPAEPRDINLIVRNMSNRPSAILHVLLQNKDDQTLIDLNLSTDRVHEQCDFKTPLRLAPWDVQIISFKLPTGIENSLDHILVVDLDGKNRIIPNVREEKWVEGYSISYIAHKSKQLLKQLKIRFKNRFKSL